MSGPDAAAGVEGRFQGRLGAFRLDAAFQLPARGLTALWGPSGAGKSTLLRCIAGLTRLDGRLLVGGEVWQDEGCFLSAHHRPVGMVFQDASLLSHLSVRGNLAFGWRRTRGPRQIAWDEAVELLGLEPLLERRPHTLSGGEKQRVALGRALLSQPRLLLMDEPLSSLDAQSKAEILPYLDRLHRALAIPALYVTHDAAEVAQLADQVLEMQAGQVTAGTAPGGLEPARRTLSALSPEERDRLALAAIAAGLRPLN